MTFKNKRGSTCTSGISEGMGKQLGAVCTHQGALGGGGTAQEKCAASCNRATPLKVE